MSGAVATKSVSGAHEAVIITDATQSDNAFYQSFNFNNDGVFVVQEIRTYVVLLEIYDEECSQLQDDNVIIILPLLSSNLAVPDITRSCEL